MHFKFLENDDNITMIKFNVETIFGNKSHIKYIKNLEA